MRIGILTFHWATNYGAVLQCYALQNFLESLGHQVQVINYKPRQYDDNIYTFLRFRKFLNFQEYINNRKKEKEIRKFRCEHLHLTERVYQCKEIASLASHFDIIVSGSDQVVNPSFLLSGEGRGIVTPTYFLGFPFKGKRIGYALSFGCVTYPEKAREIAAEYIKDFDIISVREKTGVDIVKSMGRDDAIVVPDPTLLIESRFYHQLADNHINPNPNQYIYSFFIRNIAERKNAICNILKGKHILWNNEDGDYTMQGWLNKIKHSEFVVTDSFHCVVMCLKLHKTFVIVTENNGNVGMNDRLYTLLGNIGLTYRIIYKGDINQINDMLEKEINWTCIDIKISNMVDLTTNII